MRKGPFLALVCTHKGLEVLGLIAVSVRTLYVCAKCITKPNNIPLVFLSRFLALKTSFSVVAFKVNFSNTAVLIFKIQFPLNDMIEKNVGAFFGGVWTQNNWKQGNRQTQEALVDVEDRCSKVISPAEVHSFAQAKTEEKTLSGDWAPSWVRKKTHSICIESYHRKQI